MCFVWALVALAGLVLALTLPALAQTYTVIDLGTLGGDSTRRRRKSFTASQSLRRQPNTALEPYLRLAERTVEDLLHRLDQVLRRPPVPRQAAPDL